MPKNTTDITPKNGFPSVMVTLNLSGKNNRKIQELRIERGGLETKAQLAEKLLNEYLDTFPPKP
ncbi:hypothetical protein Sbal625DRAFT_4109 [Shewanella baltica OS625]|nr:hypothetical protein Sbal625DRAFT_4109 [Shewanella baltica OS625]